MRFRSLLLAILAISVMGLAVGVTGQNMMDGIRVDLPYPVRVGDDVVLEPGEYEIRRASQNQDQILRIFSNDKMRHEVHVITIPVLENKTPEDSKVVLHHIGDDYYFDKIWIEGKDYGYEFMLPERARALQRELAETLPATYIPQGEDAPKSESQTSQAASTQQPGAAEQSSTEKEGTAAQGTTSQPTGQQTEQARTQAERDTARAEQSDREQAAIAEPRQDSQSAVEQRSESDTRPAQAQSQTGQAERSQDTGAAAQPGTQTGTAGQQRDQQADESIAAAETEQQRLPATASNWLGWILGGVALITLSAFVRSKVSE